MISSEWPMPDSIKVPQQEKAQTDAKKHKDEILSEKVENFLNTQISVQQLKTIFTPSGVLIQTEDSSELSGLNEVEMAKFGALIIKKLVKNQGFIDSFKDKEKLNELTNLVESMSVEEIAAKTISSMNFAENAAAKAYASIDAFYDQKGKIPFPKDNYPDDEPF